ncbi:hypothetical protein M9Y10_005224 [Tritrichomonas musculus]|uniref:F5/8 type C domain-containing protein n=1 Tax=Tritrichomonas musculus TaxID=1915356 RepID=A0ABR2JL29_9EUKA
MTDFNLSSSGLKTIPESILDNDFCFIFDSKQYYCSRILASFISPIVANIFQSDPLCDSFTVDINEKSESEMNNDKIQFDFDIVIQLMKGESIKIDSSNAEFLVQIGKKLGNSELVERITQNLSTYLPPLTPQNVIHRILVRCSLNLNIDTEIDFIASHFIEFGDEELISLGPSLLLQILTSSKKLQIHSESWLLFLIKRMVNAGGNSYKCLYACVDYANLSKDEFETFIDEIDLEDIDEPLWNSLKSCFCQFKQDELFYKNRNKNEQKNNINKKLNLSAIIEPSKPENMKGIFTHISEVLGANPSSVVEVTSSPFNSQYPPENVIDNSSNDTQYFESNDEPNSWICFDFKNMRVSLSHYTLKTWFWGPNFQHLKSWIVEGSDDGREWTELDQREDEESLNDALAFRRFKCLMRVTCRYIRIRSTDVDHSGSNLLILNAVEFYGRLIA